MADFNMLVTASMQGWLEKRGPMFGFKWLKRYCVLSSGRLTYYQDETYGHEHGDVEFGPSTCVKAFTCSDCPGEGIKHRAERPFGFVIDVDPAQGKCRRLFYFDSMDAESLETWSSAIKKQVHALVKSSQDVKFSNDSRYASRLCKWGRESRADVEPRVQEGKTNCRKSFRGCLVEDEKPTDVENLILISDPGTDNDDEMAMLLIAELRRLGEVELVAVVANLLPANRRAALVRGTLDLLGMEDVPVGIGSDGGSTQHTDKFSEYINEGMTGIDYFTEAFEAVCKVEEAIGTVAELVLSEEHRVYEAQRLLRKVLQDADDGSLTLILLSSIKDAAKLLIDNEKLFVDKVKSITIMGGAEFSASSGLLQPTDAHNNVFDFAAAKHFYRRCQELGKPLVLLSRFAAYGCPVQRTVYDLMVRCPVPHPTACRLQRAQRVSIDALWSDVCAGGILPARCDKKWFCDTFCGGAGIDRSSKDSMWSLVKTFNMYDPLAVLAALPARRCLFFKPHEVIGKDGTVHLNIGISQEDNGIVPERRADLHDFLMTTWIRAAGRPRGGEYTGEELRPKLLDDEQLTAALTPMPPHSTAEMDELNANVLQLIDLEWPKLKNSSLLGTWRSRDRLMRSIGPPMMVVDPTTIERLGRIPHSAENRAISLEQAAGISEQEGKRFFIEMFSHRWHSRYAPDDHYNNKARVLTEWAKYRTSMNFRTFFWIDYVCIDQSDIVPGVSMLPLYVSCCNNIVCYDTQSYEPRAWCRVERLMFVSFVAPNNEYVDPAFEYREDADKLANGDLKPFHDGKETVPDPSAGDSQLSYPADAALISDLKQLCTMHWAECWKDGLIDIVENKGGLNQVRQLRYGGTEVRVRKFQ